MIIVVGNMRPTAVEYVRSQLTQIFKITLTSARRNIINYNELRKRITRVDELLAGPGQALPASGLPGVEAGGGTEAYEAKGSFFFLFS